jgi:hypothetical protein
LLYAAGSALVYLLCGLLTAVAAVFFSRIRLVRVPLPRQPLTFESLFAGIRFIFHRQAVLGAVSLDLFAVLLGATALLPIFAQDILLVSVVIRQSLVQLETPDEMCGRVSAVNSIFIGASNQLGEFESEVTAAWWGAVNSVVVGGLGTLVVVAVWMRRFPELAQRQQLQRSPQEIR